MKDKGTNRPRMRVSFDLDEVLFVSPNTHQTEPELRWPLNRIYIERLRLGTPELIRKLQALDYEVWVYTSSERTEKYIRDYFRRYGVKFDGIVNAQRHRREVQQGHYNILPQKMPNYYHISLHVDDEQVICSLGREYGFDTYQLDEEEKGWVDNILQVADRVRKKRFPEYQEKEK